MLSLEGDTTAVVLVVGLLSCVGKASNGARKISLEPAALRPQDRHSYFPEAVFTGGHSRFFH